MLEVLQFIFSSFWIWLGSMMLIGAVGQATAAIIYSIRGTVPFSPFNKD